MKPTIIFVITAAAVVALAVGLYAASPASSGQTSTTTWVTTTSTTTTTVTTTPTTSISASSSTIAGSFTYSPSSPLQILSVQAAVSYVQSGERLVQFTVQFKNAGDSAIYVVGGCGSGLEASIPANSSVIQRAQSGPLCACAEFILPLQPGQNHTSVTPGCWSGYNVKLLGPGEATVNLRQHYSMSSTGTADSSSTFIRATFEFA